MKSSGELGKKKWRQCRVTGRAANIRVVWMVFTVVKIIMYNERKCSFSSALTRKFSNNIFEKKKIYKSLQNNG
jgi:hypothetical protein